MSQPLPDNLIRSEEEVSPAELCPSRPQPTSQTGPLYNLNHGDKKVASGAVELSWFTGSQGPQARLILTVSLWEIRSKRIGKKPRKWCVCVCVRAHTCNNMMQTG